MLGARRRTLKITGIQKVRVCSSPHISKSPNSYTVLLEIQLMEDPRNRRLLRRDAPLPLRHPRQGVVHRGNERHAQSLLHQPARAHQQ